MRPRHTPHLCIPLESLVSLFPKVHTLIHGTPNVHHVLVRHVTASSRPRLNHPRPTPSGILVSHHTIVVSPTAHVTMASRFKLRVCTWNVGNAQPPADLSSWLGVTTDHYDIIAVGAQEASFGADRAAGSPVGLSVCPTVTSPPASGVHHPDISRTPSRIPTSIRFSRLSRVFRSVRRHRTSTTTADAHAATGLPSPAMSDVTDINSSPTSARNEHTQPQPMDSNPGHMFLKQPSLSHPPGLSKISTRNFDNIDESLLIRSRANDYVDANLPPVSPLFIHTESEYEPRASSVRDARRLLSDDGPRSARISEAGLSPMTSRGRQPRLSSSGGHYDLIHRERRVTEVSTVRKRHRFRILPSTSHPRSQEDSPIFFPHSTLLGENSPSVDASYLPVEDSPLTTPTTERKFSRAVERCMPECYRLVAKHHLMEIKLMVYVHERLAARVTRAEVVEEATGIGGVVGNKGAVGIKLTLDDTAFCFVCAHLAAHEGAKFLQQRIDDVLEIMRHIERERGVGMPMMHQFDHIFWMGDLNFRLDLKHMLPAAVTWSHEDRWTYIMDLVSKRRYADLASFDELRREMGERRVFGGFVEGKLHFPPTFKVQRGFTSMVYQETRVPSYCDRILWHSLPRHQSHVLQREYNCVEEIDTSDHKPVYAVFDIIVPKETVFLSLPAPRMAVKCTIDFKRLEVHGLYLKRLDMEGAHQPKYEVTADGTLALADSGDGSDLSGSGGRTSGISTISWGTQQISTVSASTSTRRSVRQSSGLTRSPTTDSSWTGTANTQGTRNTRRGVSAYFHGGGMFVKGRAYRADVPLRDGRRLCKYGELPCIAVRPVSCLSELMYKYVRIVFSRFGSRQGSSCVLPLAELIRLPGVHRLCSELELTKYGTSVAKVEVEVELVVSMETWVDSRNHLVKAKF